MLCVVGIDGAGDQVFRHTKGGNLETTTNISYASLINFISQIIKSNVELL